MTPEEEELYEAAVEIADIHERLERLLALAEKVPNDQDIEQDIARCHLELQDIDEAERVLKSSLVRNENGWTRLYLGNLYWRKRDLASAEEQFRFALDLMPNDSVPRWCLGDILDAADRLEEAEAQFRWALTVNPSDGCAHARLGRLLLETDRVEEGTMHTFASLDLDMNDRIALNTFKRFRLNPLPRKTEKDTSLPVFAPTTSDTAAELREHSKRLSTRAMRLAAKAQELGQMALDKETHDDPRWLARKAVEAEKRATRKERAMKHKGRQRKRGHR
jgi:tetratricopeptide (TPR) repeat protein